MSLSVIDVATVTPSVRSRPLVCHTTRANVRLTLGKLGTVKGLLDDDGATCTDAVGHDVSEIQPARV